MKGFPALSSLSGNIQNFARADVGKIDGGIGGGQFVQMDAEFTANGHSSFAVFNNMCVTVRNWNFRAGRSHDDWTVDCRLDRLDGLGRLGRLGRTINACVLWQGLILRQSGI